MKKKFPLPVLSALIVMAILNYSVMGVREHLQSDERIRMEEIEAAKESIALSLLGQIQFTVGSLMWMKTMEYLHNGVPYRPPTQAEEERGFRSLDSVGLSEGLAHKEGMPVTLTRKSDWRGFVGDLHREVVPYMAEHRHSDPKELIPWYKLATRFNPNLERIFVLGAFFMTDFAGEPDEALEYLTTGIKANPWSFEIHAALGRLYHDAFREFEKAAETLEKAIELGKRERARVTRNKENFDDYQKQLFRESYLFLAKSLTELGRFDEALQVCEEGLSETNNNLLAVQKRITQRRKDGEAVTEEATPTFTFNKELASGNRDLLGDEDTSYDYDFVEDEETWVGAALSPLGLTIAFAFIAASVSVLIILWKKSQKRFNFDQLRTRRLLISGALVLLIVAGLYSLSTFGHKEKVFESPKEQAQFYRDQVGYRAKRVAPWLVAAGDSCWDQAQTNTVEENFLYEQAARYYQAAYETAQVFNKKRDLVFPSDVSLGKISIRPWGSQDEWQEVGPAQGTITIPKKHEVDFSLTMNLPLERLAELKKLPATAFQSLNCGETYCHDEVVEYFRNFAGLRYASFYATHITDKAVQVLTETARGIESLNLGKTHISDESIRLLSAFPRLRRLSLVETSITQIGAYHLSKLPSLRMLWLTQTALTDDALIYVGELQDLRVLWLGNSGDLITDQGLKHLQNLRALRELWIGSAAITADGIQQLRTHLPNCRILDNV